MHARPEKPFRVESISNDDNAISFYTSFSTYMYFMTCFTFLGEAVHHLISQNSEARAERTVTSKMSTALTAKNEFFLVLCRLRCGLMEYDLAYRFKISQSTVSRICIK